MTHFSDQLKQGYSAFQLYGAWNGGTVSGLPTATAPNDNQTHGTPHTQTFCYQIGTASTALASGIFFSASGATTGGTLTSTGALVSGGVATLDLPRAIRITASVDFSTTTFTIRGTDGYGQALTWSGVGPSGNTLGNAGSYVDSLSAFKTVTTASMTVNSATTTLMIGTSNTFGLPFRLINAGMGLGVFINGSTATVAAGNTWTAGIGATGTPTATTADVRGTVALATVVLPNDSRYFTVQMIQPNVNLTQGTDTKEAAFGPTPFSS